MGVLDVLVSMLEYRILFYPISMGRTKSVMVQTYDNDTLCSLLCECNTSVQIYIY